MTNALRLDAPSALYRRQIANISFCMLDLCKSTSLVPLRNMTAFNQAKENFNRAKFNAYICCSRLDTASIEMADRADETLNSVMEEMVFFKNQASELVRLNPSG